MDKKNILLSRIEKRVRNSGKKWVRYLNEFRKLLGSPPALRRKLGKNDSIIPTGSEIGRLYSERVADDWRPILARMRRQGYSSTPWIDITDTDRDDAEAVVSEGLIHPLLDFKVFEPNMDPALSIALRQNNKLVGWVIGETLPSTGYHHYTCGHVHPKLQRSGRLIGGIHDVCVLQKKVYGAKSVAAYETFGGNTAMINFMRRKLSDVTLWMDERFQSTKSLVSE